MSVKLYGLSTCDTCRKARNWLQRFDIEHSFVDYREQRIGPEQLLAWKTQAGSWDGLVNKSSTTWRTQAPIRKSPGSDAEWKLLHKEYPTLLKRPIVVTADGVMTQGFSDNGFKKLFGIG